MKTLLLNLTLILSTAVFAGEIKIDSYNNGQVVLHFDGTEAQEVYNRLVAKERFSGTLYGVIGDSYGAGFIYEKKGKNINCKTVRIQDGEALDQYKCAIKINHNGKVNSGSRLYQ